MALGRVSDLYFKPFLLPQQSLLVFQKTVREGAQNLEGFLHVGRMRLELLDSYIGAYQVDGYEAHDDSDPHVPRVSCAQKDRVQDGREDKA